MREKSKGKKLLDSGLRNLNNLKVYMGSSTTAITEFFDIAVEGLAPKKLKCEIPLYPSLQKGEEEFSIHFPVSSR